MPEFLWKKEVVPGIVVHTLAVGKNMMLCWVTLRKGAQLPAHSHPHEQASFVISGHLKFIVDGEEKDCPAGTGVVFPPNVQHSAYVVEDSVVTDVFSPIREDYLT